MDSIVTHLPATKTPLLVYLWMPVVAKPFDHAIVMHQEIVAAGFDNQHHCCCVERSLARQGEG
jgi:hypothetical protein